MRFNESDDFQGADDFQVSEEFEAAPNDLEYKDGVVEKLLDTIDEYLSFSTTKELIKLIGGHL